MLSNPSTLCRHISTTRRNDFRQIHLMSFKLAFSAFCAFVIIHQCSFEYLFDLSTPVLFFFLFFSLGILQVNINALFPRQFSALLGPTFSGWVFLIQSLRFSHRICHRSSFVLNYSKNMQDLPLLTLPTKCTYVFKSPLPLKPKTLSTVKVQPDHTYSAPS